MYRSFLAIRRPSPDCQALLPQRAFTLIELLIVLSLITFLMSLLIPAIVGARQQANDVVCSSNLRQLAMSLVSYANSWQGKFPPNSGEVKTFWYQKEVIGGHINTPLQLPDDSVAGGVMVCPNDFEDAIRSYSMNTFASSYVSSYVRAKVESNPPRAGKLYTLTVKDSSSIILLADSWSELAQPEKSPQIVGYAATAIMGFGGTPGQRFGVAGGVGWTGGRFGLRASQLAFYRHRTSRNPSLTDAEGRVNIAFADGHVAMLSDKDLADSTLGKSRYVALWSVIDRDLD